MKPKPIGEWALFDDMDTEPVKRRASKKKEEVKPGDGSLYDTSCAPCSRRMNGRVQPHFEVITVDGKHCLAIAHCPVCGKELGRDQYALGDKVLEMIQRRDKK